LSGQEPVVCIAANGSWHTSEYLPLVTRFFQSGDCRCLIGTRSLLGEGWDAPCANVLVDLTTAATHTSMHQMRGRTLRLDPGWTGKVADNWDVICVADLPRGGGDYSRFVRKHRSYYGLTADGAVESGVSHVHPGLSPFSPPTTRQLPELNRALLRRPAQRAEVRSGWRIGEPYRNVEVPTVRVRWERSLGVGPQGSRPTAESAEPERIGGHLVGQAAAAWAVAAAAMLFGLAWPAGVALGLLGSALAIALSAGRLGASLGHVPAQLALDGCARAVLAALQEMKEAPPSLGPEDIRIEPGADGYYRCYLPGAPAEAARLFAECVEDLLAPVENQRYVIPRYWAAVPTGAAAQTLFVLRSVMGGVGLYHAQYHPLPDHFGVNRSRADVFAKHWNRYVSPGKPVYAYSKEAQSLVSAARGADAFGLLCQLRAIWE
jgi:hypothetical protein